MLKVKVDEKTIEVYLQIPTQDLEKYRKLLIWFVTLSFPFLVATGIKVLPSGTLPLPPNNNSQEQVRLDHE